MPNVTFKRFPIVPAVFAAGMLMGNLFGPTVSAASVSSNSFTSLSIVGQLSAQIRGQLAIINQSLSDASVKKYLLIDLSVPVAPSNPLQIQTALTASVVATFTHANGTKPYVQCTLEARDIRSNLVTFSLGLKSTGNGALIRWGVCDDPALPGHDSQFPVIEAGDLLVLKAANGPSIGQYTVPSAPAVTSPAAAGRQSAVLSLLEGKAYRVAP